MSEVIVTATAWVAGEPRVTKTVEEEPVEFAWTLLAEASVTDTRANRSASCRRVSGDCTQPMLRASHCCLVSASPRSSPSLISRSVPASIY